LADVHELDDQRTNIMDALEANDAELEAIRLEYDV